MNFYTARQLRANPRDIWDDLAEKNEVIITNNGKPTALMLKINDENLEEVLASVRQAATMRAVNKLRMDSLKSGRSDMTGEEINEEIVNMRRERKNEQGRN